MRRCLASKFEVRGTDGELLPERVIGTLWVRTASVMQGYLHQPEATAEVLTPDGWLDTGDLGYLLDGRIFVTGREKDMIIVGGRNFWPQDLEYVAESQETVRTGDSMAFSISDDEGERVVLLVQSRELDEDSARATATHCACAHQDGVRHRLSCRTRRLPCVAAHIVRQAVAFAGTTHVLRIARGSHPRAQPSGRHPLLTGSDAAVAQRCQCVAVTGATGFIGTHLLHRLRLDGVAVRALTRTPRSAADTDQLTWITGDLVEGRGVEQLVDGVDAVVHCAGAVRGARATDFDAINVAGTGRLAAAAAAAGVTRGLALSSLAAREPQLSMYASSKRRGEAVLSDGPVPWTLLRPPAVYGPGDTELTPLFALMLRGLAVVPSHSGRTSLIYVTDLVRAHLRVAHGTVCSGRLFRTRRWHTGWLRLVRDDPDCDRTAGCASAPARCAARCARRRRGAESMARTRAGSCADVEFGQGT